MKTDRFVAFAFASSDLLAEASNDGVITWAAGAFASRLGGPPESFVGQPLLRLIAPGDHAALAMVLSMAWSRGRSAPIVLRLNDAAQTPCALAALLLPGDSPRLCITVGPVPTAPPTPQNGLLHRLVFRREAEARLRSGQGGGVGLVEMQGWTRACESMESDKQGALRNEIGRALAQVGGPGAVTGELGEGCFGVLGGGDLGPSTLTPALLDVLGSHALGRQLRPDVMALPLNEDGLHSSQAVRALRFALGRVAEGGLARAREEGFGDGLGGFIARVAPETEMVRDTLRARRFRLVFQPVVSLPDRRIHHFEALLRPHPTRSRPLAGSQDFVTIAEALELSEELDTAVMLEVLAALKAAPTASIAVSVSGVSIQSLTFSERIAELVKPGLARRFLVELTETDEIENVPNAMALVAALRGQGVSVCIDNFGAGTTAFRYLRDFHADYIKIDGAHVRGAVQGKRECGHVQSMLDLARNADAFAIAEMIETEQEARLMEKLGVQFGQGWLFGRPGSLPGTV
jgi:EAL domain-containing protein (putative c-di-GMP-specific phosphodiesterase class I)/PAS domain-containing protein